MRPLPLGANARTTDWVMVSDELDAEGAKLRPSYSTGERVKGHEELGSLFKFVDRRAQDCIRHVPPLAIKAQTILYCTAFFPFEPFGQAKFGCNFIAL